MEAERIIILFQWSGQRHVSDLFPSLPPDRAPHRIIRPWQPLSCYDTSSIITQQARAIHLWSWASSCDFLRLGIAKIQRSKLLLSSSLIARRASINPPTPPTTNNFDSRFEAHQVSCLLLDIVVLALSTIHQKTMANKGRGGRGHGKKGGHGGGGGGGR